MTMQNWKKAKVISSEDLGSCAEAGGEEGENAYFVDFELLDTKEVGRTCMFEYENPLGKVIFVEKIGEDWMDMSDEVIDKKIELLYS